MRSVTNAISILGPIIEDDNYSNSSSSMASKNHLFASILETHPMIFNVRLVFSRTNIHNAQLFNDPISRWVVRTEEHPTTFDPSPWIKEISIWDNGDRLRSP